MPLPLLFIGVAVATGAVGGGKTIKAATDNSKATVEVTGEVYPGTIIAISDLSMIVKSTYKYCRFVVEKGDVKMAAL